MWNPCEEYKVHHNPAPFCSVLQTTKNKKTCELSICRSLQLFASLARGPDQIRTGVGAFAELSLATRPQDHYDFRFYILDLIPIFIGMQAVKDKFFSCYFLMNEQL